MPRAAFFTPRFIECSYNPNFHFAPVVLVDHDHGVLVTLESWAVNDVDAVNSSWAFRCYSTADPLGSYHSRLVESGGYGNIALTFVVRRSLPLA